MNRIGKEKEKNREIERRRKGKERDRNVECRSTLLPASRTMVHICVSMLSVFKNSLKKSLWASNDLYRM